MPRFFKRMLNNEEGMALIVSLMVVALLTLLSAGLASMATSPLKGVKFHYDKTAALYIAEAGAMIGMRELSYRNFNDVLKGADGIGGTTDDGILSFGSEVNFGNGSYRVRVIDNDDGDGDIFTDSDSQVVISSTGEVGTVSHTVKIGIKMENNSYVLSAAILTGDDLTITGNTNILGGYGNVHSNGDLTIMGNVNVADNTTAYFDVDLTGNAHVYGNVQASNADLTGNVYVGGDVIAENVSTAGNITIEGNIRYGEGVLVDIPQINPESYIEYADYFLKGNGKVYDQYENGNLIAQGSFHYWNWNGNYWSISGNDEVDGYTYYIESDVKVTGNHGSGGNPWDATIISTEDIEMSGNIHIQPNSKNYMLVAGRDIKITGNVNVAGFVLAHEQIKFAGNASLSTGIIAESAENISGKVTNNQISGNVTYNGDLGSPVESTETFVKAAGWSG